jgi:hypothetical protein
LGDLAAATDGVRAWAIAVRWDRPKMLDIAAARSTTATTPNPIRAFRDTSIRRETFNRARVEV